MEAVLGALVAGLFGFLTATVPRWLDSRSQEGRLRAEAERARQERAERRRLEREAGEGVLALLHPHDTRHATRFQRRAEAALRVSACLALLVVVATGCMFRSTNTVTVINNSTIDLAIATESGDQGPKPLPHNHDAIFWVQRDGCMDDTLVAVDDAGRTRARNDRPCGGDLWAIYERELEPVD